MTARSEAAPDPARRQETGTGGGAADGPAAVRGVGGVADSSGARTATGRAGADGAHGADGVTGAPAPRRAIAAWAAAVGLFVFVGLAGESAAEPPLGARTAHPPWEVALGLPPAAVDGALVAAYLLAAAAVWTALRAVDDGWRPPSRSVGLAAVLAVGALVLVPPFGSADHLSYAAYGRIAAEGGDPYVVAPDAWPPGDPVVASAEVPWDDTTTVYGPVATAVQAAVGELGGGSLRLTVWLWQLVAGASFLVTGRLLARLARTPAMRARVAVLWTLNPLLLGVLVAGAHLDSLSAVAAVGCLALGVHGVAGEGRVRFAALQLAAGLALGVAAGSKLPYAAAGAALLWAYRRLPSRARLEAGAALFAGAAAVLVPAHLWAGGHVYDQARDASRFTSLATPWRPLVNAAGVLGWDGVRAAVPFAFAVVAAVTLLAAIGLLRLAGRDVDDRAAAVGDVENPAAAVHKVEDPGAPARRADDHAGAVGQVEDGTAVAGHVKDRAVAAGRVDDRATAAGHVDDRAVPDGRVDDRAGAVGDVEDGAAPAGRVDDRAAPAGHVDGRAVAAGRVDERNGVGREAVLALLVLAVAYVVAAPYVLPWYDALLFAPLALVAGTRLDRPLILRLTVLALAYVPGRAAGAESRVSDLLLDLRQFAAPVATGAVLVWVLVVGLRALRREPGH